MASFLRITLFLIISQFGFAQIQGDIRVYINNKIANFPSEDEFFNVPSENDLLIWEQGINEIFEDKIALANNTLNQLNYQIIRYKDTVFQKEYFVIEEFESQNKYWGTFILNFNACRRLIIQCPHPKHDTNTGSQGIYCFQKLNALAYFVSGIHRCQGHDFSPCSGTTKTCSTESNPFKDSDNAHTSQSVFQRLTTILNDKWNQPTFIQLHGFGKKESDPYLILSNGTKFTPEDDILPLFQENLLNQDSLLTSKIAHLDDWNRLIGRTNVQGRALNATENPCLDYATSVEGNFIHLEQERTKMRKDSVGWNKLYNALSQTFKCDPFLSNSTIQDNNIILVTPNPNYGIFTIDGIDINLIIIYNSFGQKIKTIHSQNEIYLPKSGIYYIKIITSIEKYYKTVVVL